MSIDITNFFQDAVTNSGPWTLTDVERMTAAVAKHHPNARCDWEPGDEEWARVLEPEGDGIIALICAKVPIGFIRSDLPPPGDPGKFAWFTVSSTSEETYRVDPEVLERLFGRPMSRELNWDAVSIEDLWWATV